MDITKLAAASLALVLSGWSLYEAGRSSRTLRRPEVWHRSAADELSEMSASPEEAMVLWVPGEIDDQVDPAAVEPGSLRMARSERPTKPVPVKAPRGF